MTTKEKILSSAKKLFGKNGFDGTSIRDICEDAEVAVSAIHYHFKNKEGLFQRLLDDFSQKQLNLTLKTLNNPETKEEFIIRLEMFMQSAMNAFLEEPEVFKLIHKEIENQHPYIDEIFQKTIVKMVAHIQGYLEKAKATGIVRKDLDSLVVTGILMNSMASQIKNDCTSQKYFDVNIANNEYRQHWIKNTLSVLLYGVIHPGDLNEADPN